MNSALTITDTKFFCLTEHCLDIFTSLSTTAKLWFLIKLFIMILGCLKTNFPIILGKFPLSHFSDFF